LKFRAFHGERCEAKAGWGWKLPFFKGTTKTIIRRMEFYKYHGAGNDFIVMDNRQRHIDPDAATLFQALCHRRFGIGADGLMLLQDIPEADFQMRYYNADGQPGTMCGNGGRCIVRFAHELGLFEQTTQFTAIDGLHRARLLQDGRVGLMMGPVSDLDRREGEELVVDTGSPHVIRPVSDGLAGLDVEAEGKAIRWRAEFGKPGINVNFFEPIDAGRAHLRMRTFERGVEAETYACGTGAVAVALAWREHFATMAAPKEVTLETRGGTLTVAFGAGVNSDGIELIGSAVSVYRGTLDPAQFMRDFPGSLGS
jgi:diaminopimelate epimerase